MGLFRKIVQQLYIDFYSRNDASVKFESLSEEDSDDFMSSYYFLTYYAKMLFNLGSGDNSHALHLFISDIIGSALYDKAPVDESLKLVRNRGKGDKTYSAEWDKNGIIKTKVAFGEEEHYATASVLIFLDYLNQNLPELSRQILFYCIFEFQNAVSEFGIPKVQDTVGWASETVSKVVTNLDEYHKMRTDAEKEYMASKQSFPSQHIEEKKNPKMILEELPNQISTFFTEEKIQTYEQIELGASLLYRAAYIKASIIIFDLGHSIIPDGKDSDILKQAYIQTQSDIIQAESMGMYENVFKLSDESIDIELNKNKTVSLLSASFSCDEIKDEGLKYNVRSDLYLTGIRNHIIKIRVTYPNLHAEDAKPQIYKLLEGIFGILVSVDN